MTNYYPLRNEALSPYHKVVSETPGVEDVHYLGDVLSWRLNWERWYIWAAGDDLRLCISGGPISTLTDPEQLRALLINSPEIV